MARYLVLGDPVVALGPAALIPDGALIVEGAEITAAGPLEVLAARGPFDRVLGSAGHFVMPGCDLLVVRKDRILFPPGRYDGEPFLDVVVDRAEAQDIDVVLGHGRVLMEGGRVTVVNEDQVRERFAAAVAERVYRPSAAVRRWAGLGVMVEPYLAPLYQPWYHVPVEPAHAYNARRMADGGRGGDRGAD